MEATLKIVEKNLSLSFSNQKDFTFNLDDVVDLTDLITTVALFEEVIQIVPESLENIIEEDTPQELIKLTEYIYKLLNLFNSAFEEAYPKAPDPELDGAREPAPEVPEDDPAEDPELDFLK